MNLRMTFASLLVCLLATTSAFAANPCGYACAQDFTNGTSYPFAEMISYPPSNEPPMPHTLTGPTNTWTPIQYPCTSGVSKYNVRSLNPFNLLIRANLKINASTAAPGAVYGVRFRLVSESSPVVEYDAGSYIRSIRPVSGSGDPTLRQALLEQSDTLNGTAHNIPAGNYQLITDARLLSPGTITFDFAFVTAQGAPTSVGGQPTGYASGKSVAPTGPNDSKVAAWSILNEITFTTDKELNIFPQGFVQVDGGVELDPIALSIELDGVSFVSELSLAGLANEGFNVFSHFFKIQPGTHTLRLWGVNRAGRDTVMKWRQIEFVSFPIAVDPAMPNDPTYGEKVETSTKVVTSAGDSVQPTGFYMVGLGGLPWTKIAEFTFTKRGGEANSNWIGDIYIDFLGRGIDASGTDAGNWTEEMVQIGVEVKDATGSLTDMGVVRFGVPHGKTGLSSFIDAVRWGNDGSPATVTLWMRKTGPPGTYANFRVGKRWLGAAIVPMALPSEVSSACFQH